MTGLKGRSTVGWICTEPLILEMARAMLDEEYEDPSLKPTDTNMPYRGRIGSVNVLIHCLPEPTGTADGAYMAQNMTPSFGLIENILITGLDPGVADAGMRLGDLIICPAMARLAA